MIDPPSSQSCRIVIAGGGVAALECALALQVLGGDRAEVTVMTATRDFDWPVRVSGIDPFGARRYAIAAIVGDRVRLVREHLAAVDVAARTVTTAGGSTWPFDRLIVACGARPAVRYPHAVTLDEPRLDAVLRSLLADIRDGTVTRLAFVVPQRAAWGFPLYELALCVAERCRPGALSTFIVTPETAPLEAYGETVSRDVTRLLRSAGIELRVTARAEVPRRREVVVSPGHHRLPVDRVISVPELFGLTVEGLPSDSAGFLPIDGHCRVPGAGPIYAIGDACNFRVKHASLAAQMAVVAASSALEVVGTGDRPTALRPQLRSLLVTDGRSKFLAAHLVDGLPVDSRVSDVALWEPPDCVSTRYLTRRLQELDHA